MLGESPAESPSLRKDGGGVCFSWGQNGQVPVTYAGPSTSIHSASVQLKGASAYV